MIIRNKNKEKEEPRERVKEIQRDKQIEGNIKKGSTQTDRDWGNFKVN